MLRFGESFVFALPFTFILLCSPAHAATPPALPEDFTVEGRLYDSTGAPIATSADFKLEVLDENNPACVLYREYRSADLSSSDPNSQGVFSFRLGAVTPDFPVSSFVNLFSPGAQSGENGCAFTAQPGSHRLVHVSVKKSSDTTYEVLGPDTKITSVPLAKVAENALSLQGVGTSGLLLLNGTSSLQQGNVEEVFSLLNFPKLQALLNGNSAAYLPSTPTAPVGFNNQRLTGIQDPVNPQDAATKNYADTMVAGHAVDLTAVGPMTGNNNTLLWDATANKWVAGAINTSPTGAAGGDLSGTYPNPTIKNDAVTAAKIASTGGGPNRLLVTDPTTGASIGYATCGNVNEIYAWTPTGWGCTTVSALSPVTTVAGRTGDIVLTAGDIGGLGTAALYDYGSGANQIVRLDAQASLPPVDASQLLNVNAVQIQGRAIASTHPSISQVLGWNGLAWIPMNAATGTVTNVSSGTGLTGGPITTTGSLSVDVGTAANKIVQLDPNAKIPALDGSQLYNINASTIGTRAVSTTQPNPAQVLAWNATTSQWSPSTAATGTVTYVASGTGLIGGPFSTAGTLAVDTGTIAGKIVQLDLSAKLPAVDGSQLYAVKLGTRQVSEAQPANAQVLAWNQTSSQWMPSTASTGTVTSIYGGFGILGGPIATTGTLAVDVGSAPGKIVIENSIAQIAQIAQMGYGATRPSYTFVQDTSTGLYMPGYGQIALSTAGSPAIFATGMATFGAPGVGIGTTTPLAALDVYGIGAASALIVPRDSLYNRPTTAVDGMIRFNTTTSSLETVAGGTWMSLSTGSWVSNVTAGSGLLGGVITSSGTLAVDVGTTISKIMQIQKTGFVPPLDGSMLYNVNATYLAGYYLSSALPSDGQVISWSALGTKWVPVTPASGSVTNVTAGPGLKGGPIVTTGTLAVDVGTTASKILQMDSSAKIPAVDASQLYNVNASKIATRTVASTNPGSGQVLGWNVTASQWEPVLAATGSVQSVTSGLGLQSGTITSNGTINVDVGTVANKIMQLNSNAQIPAVDASLLYNVNASKISTRTVASINPINNQVLGWNQLASQWEPQAGNANSVTNITAGSGLNGGTIVSVGTISVDAGTLANKIMQLDPTAKIPAVDASQLYNVNASKIGTRPVSTTQPSDAQVLGWNQLASSWLPTSRNGGSVTSILAGTGLTGGTITVAGTLAVDVGTGPSKIPQLSSVSQLLLDDTGAGNPTYSFANSPNTGFFRTAANDIGVSFTGGQTFTFGRSGSFGIGTTVPAAALDIFMTGSASAIILPRDTTSNRPPFPTGGYMRYNVYGRFEGYQAGQWVGFLTAPTTVTSQIPIATGTTGVHAGSSNLTFTDANGLVLNGTNSALTVNNAATFNGNVTVNATGTSTFNGSTIMKSIASQKTQDLAVAPSTSLYTIDGSSGNLFTTSHNCAQSIQVNNLTEGASYTIIVTDLTAAKCDFAGSGTAGTYKFYYMPANDQRLANSHTIYNLLVVGTRVYVSWSTGFVPTSGSP